MRFFPVRLLVAFVTAVGSLSLLAPSLADGEPDAASRMALWAAALQLPVEAPQPAPITSVPIELPAEGDWAKREVVPAAPTPGIAEGAGAASDPPAPVPAPVPPRAAEPPPVEAAQPSGAPRWERLGHEALRRARFAWRGLGWHVEFQPGRSGRLGYADRDRNVVSVYVRDGHTVEQVTATLAHELAHVIDYERLTPDQRRRWLDVRGIAGVDWWPSCSCDDRRFGAGDLAEAAAMLAAGPDQWTGHYGRPTAEQLQVAAELLGWSG